MPVSRKLVFPAALGALLLAMAGCAPPGSPGPAAVTPLASGQARIWFFRDYDPFGSRNYATIELSGQPPVYVKPDGSSTYRDVPPGQYLVKADSVGSTGKQEVAVALNAGDEAYLRVQSLPEWISSGDTSSFRRDTFEVSLVPAPAARGQLAAHPFGGS